MGVSFGSRGPSKNAVKYSNLPESISYIWDEYLSNCKNNSTLFYEMNQKAITYKNKILSFDMIIKGEEVKGEGYPLYIVLHHGKIGQSSYNNGEFIKAKFRYQYSVHHGIIVGVRGVTDLSNMHYSKESIVLLDRLIKNFIAFHKADPNRVYLIGLGFGGDGVYQIVNLLSCKISAAVVVSGHSYGQSLKNVLNVPLLIQVGENDYYFEKNKDAVITYKKIKEHYDSFKNKCKQLAKTNIIVKDNNEFSNSEENTGNVLMNNLSSSSPSEGLLSKEKMCPCQCYIHVGQEQEINDYDKKLEEKLIIADPIKWMTSNSGNENKHEITNSIYFLNQFVRDAFPKNLYWDLTCTIAIPDCSSKKAPGDDFINTTTIKESTKNGGGGFFSGNYGKNEEKNVSGEGGNALFNRYYYWLEIGCANVSSLGNLEVIARYDTKSNTFFIDTPIKEIRILINEKMMDLSKDINVVYNRRQKSLKCTKNYQTERRTLNERGDYTYIFSVCILFESKNLNTFKISQYEE